jgi:hypothetical protein
VSDAARVVLDQAPSVVNIGLEAFAVELEASGARVIQVDWQPLAGGTAVAALLARLDD